MGRGCRVRALGLRAQPEFGRRVSQRGGAGRKPDRREAQRLPCRPFVPGARQVPDGYRPIDLKGRHDVDLPLGAERLARKAVGTRRVALHLARLTQTFSCVRVRAVQDPKATYYQLLDELRVRVSKACEHLEGPLREVVLEGAISPTTASSAAAAPPAAAAGRASPAAPSPRATRATSSSAASPTATVPPVAPPSASRARRSPRPADPEAAEPPPRSNAARKRAKTS